MRQKYDTSPVKKRRRRRKKLSLEMHLQDYKQKYDKNIELFFWGEI